MYKSKSLKILLYYKNKGRIMQKNVILFKKSNQNNMTSKL